MKGQDYIDFRNVSRNNDIFFLWAKELQHAAIAFLAFFGIGDRLVSTNHPHVFI